MRKGNLDLVLLFDGVCNLCDGTVRFVAKRDSRRVFKFAPLQSEAGKGLLAKFHLSVEDVSTMVLIEGDRVYTESSAALEITKRLRGLWPLVYGLIVIPKPVRDWAYRIFARNRYRWFGKKESCMIPDAELKERFLES